MSHARAREWGCESWSNGPSTATTMPLRLLAERTDRLYAIAYLMMRDRASAEDAVQDACLKAWRDLPGLREPDRCDAWLRRLIVRACLDQLRRRRRRPPEIALSPTHDLPAPDAVARIANADELGRAFQRLSPTHRAVVVLSHLEELSTAEIASALDIPPGTVKSRLHHALRALRAAIEADARMTSGPRGETA